MKLRKPIWNKGRGRVLSEPLLLLFLMISRTKSPLLPHTGSHCCSWGRRLSSRVSLAHHNVSALPCTHPAQQCCLYRAEPAGEFFFSFQGGAGEEETPFLMCSSPLSFTRLLSACSQWRVRAWEQQALGSVIDGQTGRRGSRTRTPPRSAPRRGAPAPHCRRGLRLLVLAHRCVGASGVVVSWMGARGAIGIRGSRGVGCV